MLNYFYNWGDISQYISGVLLVTFIGLYSLFAKWWKHAVGWVVVTYAASLVLILVPSIAAISDPALFANFASTTWYKVLETINLTFLTGAAVTGNVVWAYLHHKRNLPGERHGSQEANQD